NVGVRIGIDLHMEIYQFHPLWGGAQGTLYPDLVVGKAVDVADASFGVAHRPKAREHPGDQQADHHSSNERQPNEVGHFVFSALRELPDVDNRMAWALNSRLEKTPSLSRLKTPNRPAAGEGGAFASCGILWPFRNTSLNWLSRTTNRSALPCS